MAMENSVVTDDLPWISTDLHVDLDRQTKVLDTLSTQLPIVRCVPDRLTVPENIGPVPTVPVQDVCRNDDTLLVYNFRCPKCEAPVSETIEKVLEWMYLRFLRSMVHNETILLFCFSLRELVSLLKSLRTGWGPPQELVMRRLNSKFWVMEADVWADLLKICRWANPTTRQDVLCVICGDVWYKPQTVTPCGHAFCGKCIYTELKRGVTTCPKCQKTIRSELIPNEYVDKLLELYYEQKDISEEELAEFRPVVGQKRKREGSAEPLAKKHKSSIQDPAPLDVQQPTRSHTVLTLKTLYEDLLPLAPEWFDYGLALGITYDTLSKIRHDCKDMSNHCLRETIQHALSVRPGLTMEDIVKALKSPTVNRLDIVEKVQSEGTTLT